MHKVNTIEYVKCKYYEFNLLLDTYFLSSRMKIFKTIIYHTLSFVLSNPQFALFDSQQIA
jgi:hypothetical protein